MYVCMYVLCKTCICVQSKETQYVLMCVCICLYVCYTITHTVHIHHTCSTHTSHIQYTYITHAYIRQGSHSKHKFFTSKDQRFFIKTIPAAEARRLLNGMHICEHTLLMCEHTSTYSQKHTQTHKTTPVLNKHFSTFVDASRIQ
jgi:hypothetical protein